MIGTVLRREVISPHGRQPHVKARLDLGDGREVVAVWWDEYKAPAVGARVSIRGDVRVYQGIEEIHVRETTVERPLPDDPLARLIGYHLERLEAEAAAALSVNASGSNFIDLARVCDEPLRETRHKEKWRDSVMRLRPDAPVRRVSW